MQRFADTYGPAGAQVVAIEDSGVGLDKVNLFARTLNVRYPLYFDPTRKITPAYAIRTSSTAYVISPDFVVRERVEEGATFEYLERKWKLHGEGR